MTREERLAMVAENIRLRRRVADLEEQAVAASMQLSRIKKLAWEHQDKCYVFGEILDVMEPPQEPKPVPGFMTREEKRFREGVREVFREMDEVVRRIHMREERGK